MRRRPGGGYCSGYDQDPESAARGARAEGQQLWDGIVNGLGEEVLTAGGGLAGQFNVFVTVPDAGRRLSWLGGTLRFGTSIERRLSEIAVIMVGARWQAEFEWWAHAAMAREHGVADAVVDAIGRGEDPPFEGDDERAVYAAARQLSHAGRLDQVTYDAAHAFSATPGWWSWCRCAGTTR